MSATVRNFTCPLTEAPCDRPDCSCAQTILTPSRDDPTVKILDLRPHFCALERQEASQHNRDIARQQETALQREHQLRFEQAVTSRNREAIALILAGGFTKAEIFEIARRRGYRWGWAWYLINRAT
jgi:hypothetical protein